MLVEGLFYQLLEAGTAGSSSPPGWREAEEDSGPRPAGQTPEMSLSAAESGTLMDHPVVVEPGALVAAHAELLLELLYVEDSGKAPSGIRAWTPLLSSSSPYQKGNKHRLAWMHHTRPVMQV